MPMKKPLRVAPCEAITLENKSGLSITLLREGTVALERALIFLRFLLSRRDLFFFHFSLIFYPNQKGDKAL